MKLKEEPKLKTRAEKVMNAFKKEICKEINQALLEKHKILFAFMLSICVMKADNTYNQAIYDVFSNGLKADPELPTAIPENPMTGIITELQWKNILFLSQKYKETCPAETVIDLAEQIKSHKEQWQIFICSESEVEIPEPVNNYSPLLHLALYKILKPEHIISIIKQVVNRVLGEDTLKNKQTSLKDAYSQCSSRIPFMFILTPGNDPMQQLLNFSNECENSRLEIVSLGQGQDTLAKKKIKEFRKSGGWLLLQNCHLYSSWMPYLNKIIEKTSLIPNDKTLLNPEFRLWLTSASSSSIPIGILQACVKYVNEPLRGLKSRMSRIYNNIKETKTSLEEYENHKSPNDWKKLFMGLAYFHSILCERARYGSIGWHGLCQFTDSDLNLAKRLLYKLLEESRTLPFEMLHRTTIGIFYTARLLDPTDEPYISNLLSEFYNDNVVYSDHHFCKVDESYYIPQLNNIEEYIAFIEKVRLSILIVS